MLWNIFTGWKACVWRFYIPDRLCSCRDRDRQTRTPSSCPNIMYFTASTPGWRKTFCCIKIYILKFKKYAMEYFHRFRLRSLCAVVDISDRLCSCRGKLTNKPEVLVSSYFGYVAAGRIARQYRQVLSPSRSLVILREWQWSDRLAERYPDVPAPAVLLHHSGWWPASPESNDN